MCMKKSPNRRYSSRRLTAAIVMGVAAVVTAGVALRTSDSSTTPTSRAFAFNKTDPDMLRPADNKRALAGPNESRFPDYTAEVESYLLRAYPEAEVPSDATLTAWSGWAAINASAHSTGAWQLIGPS